MNEKKLISLIEKDTSFKSFHLNQIRKGIYFNLFNSFDEITSLPKSIRNTLKDFPIFELKPVSKKEGKDVIKVLFETVDKRYIESVLMIHKSKSGKRRNTICISSQSGCPMKCSFCATGKMGFFRNLEFYEILEQVLFFARELKKEDEKIQNIVFMGMGEPFHNYENVMKAVFLLNNKNGFNLGSRHISISTCGIVPQIKRFADEKTQVNLAISLHAPDNETRSKLMPVNKIYPIEELLKAVDYYIDKTNRKVMFEYLLIEGVNDTLWHAQMLAKLMKKRLYHVNLIKYHDTGEYKASSQYSRKAFFDFLKKSGINVTFRVSFGEDVSAACGQLYYKSK